jgi:hypothetical protein
VAGFDICGRALATLALAAAISAAATIAAAADDPMCGEYAGSVSAAADNDSVGGIDAAIHRIPPGCAELKSRAAGIRAAILRRVAHRKDDADYSYARSIDTVEAYQAYLDAHPGGAHSDAADERIAALTPENTDDGDFQRAQQQDTVSAYTQYLSEHPEGVHMTQANQRIAQLENQPPPTSGVYKITVCNKSTKEAGFAMIFQPVGETGNNWRHIGWFKVAPGACKYMFDTGNPNFAMRAQSTVDASYWADNDFPVCFEDPGPFDFMLQDKAACPAGSTPMNAHKLTATAAEYTWNITD